MFGVSLYRVSRFRLQAFEVRVLRLGFGVFEVLGLGFRVRVFAIPGVRGTGFRVGVRGYLDWALGVRGSGFRV